MLEVEQAFLDHFVVELMYCYFLQCYKQLRLLLDQHSLALLESLC